MWYILFRFGIKIYKMHKDRIPYIFYFIRFFLKKSDYACERKTMHP